MPGLHLKTFIKPTIGVQHKLTLTTAITPKLANLIEGTDKILNDDLILSIVINPTYDDKYRKMFSVPVREGGLIAFSY